MKANSTDHETYENSCIFSMKRQENNGLHNQGMKTLF
ncbi:hypothetical protein [Lachnoclostridium sp. Marseille-P6806]